MSYVKTSELIGSALDWAVAKAERSPTTPAWLPECDEILLRNYVLALPFSPSTDWSQGGPIIEREGICLTYQKYDCWTAIGQDSTDLDCPLYQEDGPTPLVTAMRCFVASKLGDEVEIPDCLL